jgi:hypothetical protein
VLVYFYTPRSRRAWPHRVINQPSSVTFLGNSRSWILSPTSRFKPPKVAFKARMNMSRSSVRENRDHNHYMAKRKKAICEFDSSNEQKNEINLLIHYFLLKPQFQKMTERAQESNDLHTIVAARCP